MAEGNNKAAQVSDFIVGLAVFLLCLYISMESFSLGPRARMLPLLIAFCLGAVSLFHALSVSYRLIGRRLRTGRMWSADVHLLAKKNVIPLIAAAMALLYVFSIEPIGFEISSFLFLFLVMILIEPTVTMTKLSVAVAAPAVLYLVFAYGLQLRLPLLLSHLLK